MNIPLKSPSATEKNGPAPVWFHCNICSVQPSPDRHPKLTFFVSSCQHIYCNVCLHNFASSDACPLCQNKMKLVEFRKVGPNVVSMFESVLPGVKKTLIATQFQFKQAGKKLSQLRLVVSFAKSNLHTGNTQNRMCQGYFLAFIFSTEQQAHTRIFTSTQCFRLFCLPSTSTEMMIPHQ